MLSLNKEKEEKNSILDDFDADDDILDFGDDESSVDTSELDDFEINENIIPDEQSINSNQQYEFEQPAVNLSKEDKEVIEEQSTSMEETSENKGNNTETVKESKELPKRILYIVADKAQYGMLSYFRGYGLDVSQIFTDIQEAIDTIMMQVEPMRIVILDSGTGIFAGMKSRAILEDIIGMYDENIKITVFYSDAIVKESISNKAEIIKARIQWYRYRSTADCLANMLKNKKKESYVLDMEQHEEDVDESILDTKGIPAKDDTTEKYGLPILNEKEIANDLDSESDTEHIIPGYAIKF